MKPEFKYVLVTPVKDEEATIGRTIESVIRQTILPSEWVIVSDGSTDRTDAIVREAAARHPWIRLLPLAPRLERSFAAVVRNTETGIRHLGNTDYRFLGLLDSDVEFQTDYFETLMSRFLGQPDLGLAGGVVIDVGLPKDQFPRNRQDVPGAVQFFRRECFERLGPLIPVPEGGWDGLTCAMARMYGYQTRLFTDLVVDHLKPRNISQGGVVRRKWQMGVRDYVLGYHPLFELVKCASRLAHPPFLIGAVAWYCGYLASFLKKPARIVSPEVISHLRREQFHRLKAITGWGTKSESPAIHPMTNLP